MRRAPAFLLVLRLAALGIAAVPLAGCGGDDIPPPEPYTPLHYEYLKQLRLNVGSIDVQDQSLAPMSGDVTGQDPVSPPQVLAQLARDRLFAAGVSGRAVFTIEAASIARADDGALNGILAARLEVFSEAGAQAASAEARITRSHRPGSDPENLHNTLYDMTRDMMSDMNVELEFQIRRTMHDWLVTDGALPAPVTAVPLNPAAPSPAPPSAAPPPDYLQELGPQATQPPPRDSLPPPPDPSFQPPPLQPPGQDLPQDQPMGPGDTGQQPQMMSPPPGYLQPHP